jgi:hypothetical protein
MHIEKLVKIRPFLYHLTDRANIIGIKKYKKLFSSKHLMEISGKRNLLRTKRTSHVELIIGDVKVKLRDQRPLYNGNIVYEGGWNFEDLISELNERVFFWPGTSAGPISYGIRHFRRYASENPLMLRIPTSSVAYEKRLQVCGFNSGSPRCTSGHGSKRGPNTFVPPKHWMSTASRIIEVVIKDEIDLPVSTEINDGSSKEWIILK